MFEVALGRSSYVIIPVLREWTVYEPERERTSSVRDPHLLALLSAHGQRQLQL